jgi:hypothetical protein
VVKNPAGELARYTVLPAEAGLLMVYAPVDGVEPDQDEIVRVLDVLELMTPYTDPVNTTSPA